MRVAKMSYLQLVKGKYRVRMVLRRGLEPDSKPAFDARCLWYGRAFTPRAAGGSTHKFCLTGHRRVLDRGISPYRIASVPQRFPATPPLAITITASTPQTPALICRPLEPSKAFVATPDRSCRHVVGRLPTKTAHSRRHWAPGDLGTHRRA